MTRATTYRTFTAILTDPSGYWDSYRVEATSKTEARKQIAAIYRTNTPSPRYGFYSFSQNTLRWAEEE